MSVDELTQGHQAAWRRTYSYGGMARRILGSRVQVPLSVAANLGYRYYAWHLDKFYTCDWIVPAAPHREAS